MENQLLDQHLRELVIIFGFVIMLVALGTVRRILQNKLWHDTARLALEKGQPLPSGMAPFQEAAEAYRAGIMVADIRRGLIIAAVGMGLYYAIPGPGHLWAYLPLFIGIAFLVAGLIRLAVGDKNPEQKDTSGPM